MLNTLGQPAVSLTLDHNVLQPNTAYIPSCIDVNFRDKKVLMFTITVWPTVCASVSCVLQALRTS